MGNSRGRFPYRPRPRAGMGSRLTNLCWRPMCDALPKVRRTLATRPCHGGYGKPPYVPTIPHSCEFVLFVDNFYLTHPHPGPPLSSPPAERKGEGVGGVRRGQAPPRAQRFQGCPRPLGSAQAAAAMGSRPTCRPFPIRVNSCYSWITLCPLLGSTHARHRASPRPH